eukprot:10049432-Karenia_brevis.AAC.1
MATGPQSMNLCHTRATGLVKAQALYGLQLQSSKGELKYCSTDYRPGTTSNDLLTRQGPLGQKPPSQMIWPQGPNAHGMQGSLGGVNGAIQGGGPKGLIHPWKSQQ